MITLLVLQLFEYRSFGSRSEDQQTDTDHYQTPEPDLNSSRSGRPESSSSEQLESPDRSRSDSRPKFSTTSFDQNQSQGWADYDPTQPAWDDETAPPEEPAAEDYSSTVPQEYSQESIDYGNNYGTSEEAAGEEYTNYEPADGFSLVGKLCQTLYPYESQNQDDLSFLENESLTILEALDKDWVKAQNDRCNS